MAATFLGEAVGLKLLGCKIPTWIFGENVDFCDACKMEVNYNGLKMIQLRALVREHGLQGYSRLRKAELIAFLWNNIQPRPMPASPQSVSLQPRPLEPTRPPPPPPEDLFNPYELE